MIFNFSPKQKKILEKNGIITDTDLLYYFPKDYRIFTPLYTILDISILKEKKDISCTAKLLKVYSGKNNIVRGQFLGPNQIVFYVTWFQTKYMYQKLTTSIGNLFSIGGTIELTPYGLQITNPTIFKEGNHCIPFVYPVYKKIKGINEEASLRPGIASVLQNDIESVLPTEISDHFSLISRKDALCKIHFPQNGQDVYLARQYFVIEQIYNFTRDLSAYHVSQKNGAVLTKHEIADKIIGSLPYELTNSQKEISSLLLSRMESEEKVSSLVQGDVGCGKTTIAQYTALAMAESGYQVALIAPTTVLASQHYDGIVSITKPYSDIFHPLLFNGGMTAKHKKETMDEIRNKEANIIIGTTAILNAEFQNLGLIIIDEEHRFGVAQKEMLSKASGKGIHTITMSATPIPRSLACVVYAGTSSVYQVTDLPKGRKPVSTYLINNSSELTNQIETARKKGEKVYIICPKIESDDNTDKTSVEAAYKKYRSILSDPDKIVAVTGKMKTEEIQKKVQEFKDGIYNVLISTTVVEVGVNVPDATIIVIEDADMFGLSQLHQLRGRVGRSSIQSYCYLAPRPTAKEKAINRLKILCSSNDGFIISSADLEERGPGDILGTKQSGNDSDLLLILKYPNTFDYIRNCITQISCKTA